MGPSLLNALHPGTDISFKHKHGVVFHILCNLMKQTDVACWTLSLLNTVRRRKTTKICIT